MIYMFKQFHRIIFYLWILFFFFIFYPIYHFTARNPRFFGVLNKFRYLNSFFPSALSGVFYRFYFDEKLDKNQTYIYCANHTSILDIMIMCLLAKGKFHFMGKDELLNNPVLRIFFKTIDIAVNRDSKISSFKAFKKASQNLDKGMSLIIFPEGKIDDHYPPKLHAFKNGPFRLAIEKKVPILPVTIPNVWKIMWDDGGKYGTKPGICDIYIHKPVHTEHLSVEDADDLKQDVYDKINSKLIQT